MCATKKDFDDAVVLHPTSACNFDFSNPANDVLVATPASTATTNEDTISSNIILNGTAADGVVLNVEIVTNPSKGSLDTA